MAAAVAQEAGVEAKTVAEPLEGPVDKWCVLGLFLLPMVSIW